MMVEPIVSVIVPVYRVESYLDRCIQSIVSQTYGFLDIILVDDGSPDNCPGMCDEWAQNDSRIKVIHKDNGGLSDARNAGLKSASGEYIAFVDSDDWIAPEFIERLLSAMRNDGSQIAACTVKMVWEDGTPSEFLTVQKRHTLSRVEAQKALLEENLLKQPVWYKLYKKETIAGINFEKGKQHEDVFWSYQAVGAASRVSIVDYVGYYYYQRPDSIMGKGYSLNTLDVFAAYENRYSYCLKHFPELACEAKIAIVKECIYHGQMALKNLKGEERKQAFVFLNKVKNNYPLESDEYRNLKITHRVWLIIARYSLLCVCMIKNLIRVGL